MNIEPIHFEKKKDVRSSYIFVFIGAMIIAFVSGYFFHVTLLVQKGPDERITKISSSKDKQSTTTVEIVVDKDNAPGMRTKKVDFDIYWKAWDHIKKNYVETNVSDPKLFYGSLEGMVASLGDPYSVFFEPETSQKFQQEIAGSFDGIGAEIGLKNNVVTVISPLSGSPAQKAGLKAGDSIISINGKETKNISLGEAVDLIRGPKGTKVTLVIYRKGEKDTRTIEVFRGKISIKSVEWSQMDGNIIDLKLKYFNEDTLKDFRNAVNEIVLKKPKGIILDIRDNPGGLLSTAVEIASFWVGGSDIIVVEKGRDGKYVGEKAMNKNPVFKSIPTVVLINKGSASGSEILAGALQDYKLAKVVGETSFGKGSVQDLREFSDGSSLKLTIAKWYTPYSREINERGIDPDIKVELTDEDWNNDRDPQLEKALEILKK